MIGNFESGIERLFGSGKRNESLSLLVTGLDVSLWSQLADKIYLLAEDSQPNKIDPRQHPDFIWIEPAKNRKMISIDQIRNALQKIGLSKHQLKHKFVLIPQANLLNKSSQNALLKILEEPPRACFFVLGAEFKNQLLPTVVSRCQHLKNDSSSENAIDEPFNTLKLSEKETEEIKIWSEGSQDKAFLISKNLEYWKELKSLYSEINEGRTLTALPKMDKVFKDRPKKTIDFVKLVILEEKNKLRQAINNNNQKEIERNKNLIEDLFEGLKQLESNNGAPQKSVLQMIASGISLLD